MVPSTPDRIERLPLFPLHAVLFPHATLALKVFEARYLDLIAECLRGGQPFGVCLIRAGEEVGAPAETHPVGTLAHIGRWEMERPGVLLIEARGGARFAVERTWLEGKRRWASVRLLEDSAADIPSDLQFLGDLASRLDEAGSPPPVGAHAAASLSWALAAQLPLPNGSKLALLRENDPQRRLRQIAEVLSGFGDPGAGAN